MSKIIDLTHPLTDHMPVYQSDDPVTLTKTRSLQADKYNDWCLCSGMHVGTHIDGPGHLTDSAVRLSDISIDRFMGTGYLIDARDRQVIGEDLLANLPAQDNLVVLVWTGWDKKFGTQEYFDKHPILTPEFAEKLISRNVKIVGIDSFSPDKYPFEVHKLFFRNSILIIENLSGLEQVAGVRNFTVFALPLKTETDSALARVIALVD